MTKVKTALISFLFLLLSSTALAAPHGLIITEVMYNPTGSDGDTKKEWVEVYNDSADPAEIVGGSSPTSLRFNDHSGSEGHDHTFKDRGTVAAHTYFIIARSSSVFKSSYPSYGGQVFEVSMSLGNSQNTLEFRDGTGGAVLSSSKYDSVWGNKEGWTLEKKNLSGPDDPTNWVQSSVEGGTPGQAYSEPEAEEETVTATYPETVKINEFLPDPESGNEWVELYNSSSAAATLKNWQIDDKEGGSPATPFNAALAPLSYYVYYFSTRTFDNGGDTVRLIRPDAAVFDSFNYTKSTKGYSYALFSGSFLETSKPTPGEANVFAANPNIFEGNILDIKRLPVGHDVSLTAVVCAPENLLGEKELYVCDKDNGIKISYSQALSRSLSVGDKIKVASTLKEGNDEKYIKTETVSFLESQVSNVEERRILTGEVSELFEGMLVRVAGKLEEQSGNTFYLNDGSGRAKIYIKESTGIVKPAMEISSNVRVVGVVSQYGKLKSGDGNYRVLPRFQNDLYVYPKEEEAGQILSANTQVIELPATGPNQDTHTLGWLLIFLGLSGRLFLKSQSVLKCKNGEKPQEELAPRNLGFFNFLGFEPSGRESVEQWNYRFCGAQSRPPP